LEATIEIPKAFADIFNPHRCKVFYGGRGGGKSEAVARYLLVEGAKAPINILCCREFQASIKDSVHHLLADLIDRHGLSSFYRVLNSEIRGKNGTLFIFAGLRNNIASIKSMHDITKCWCEEAQTLSAKSLTILFPTIRAEGSELIFTMNPELEEDPSYQMLIADPPPDSLVRLVNYPDNPFFPEVLKIDMEHMKVKNPEEYLHIWEGKPRAAVQGAIFVKEMAKALEEGRITNVPVEKTKPVDVHFDLGRADKTAMWFTQWVGMECHLLDYFEDRGEHFSHYIQQIKSKPYTIGTLYLPHDAENEQLSAQKTIKQQAIDAFPSCRVEIVQRIPRKALAIDSARAIFDRCYFDKEKCADGIMCLRRYAYKVNDDGVLSREPDHDTPWSHGADAFLSIGQSLLPMNRPKPPKPHVSIYRGM
jgi:phage terminase large subunit